MYIHAGTQERERWRKAAKGTRWLRVEWRDEIQVDVPRYSAGLANRPDRHWVISRRHVDSSSPEPNQWKKHHPQLNSPLRLMHCHHPTVPLSWNTTHPHHFLLPSIHFLLHPSASDAISTFTDVYGRHKMKKKALLSSRHSPVIHKISFQNKPVNMYRTLKTKNARLYQSWSGSSLSQSFLSPNSVIKHSKLILLRHLHFSFLSWVPDIALFFVWNPLPCCCLLQNTVLKNSDTRINVWPWSGVRADFFFLILIYCNPL